MQKFQLRLGLTPMWTGVRGSDYATIKYDSEGRQLWVALYNGPGNGNDIAAAIFVDSKGYIYVTGGSAAVGTPERDYATIKYDSEGNEVWVARYDGPAHQDDMAFALTVDAEGHVYVTGGGYGVDTGFDCATIKYDPEGNELWAARYNGPGNRHDTAWALALDAKGNVYVTGDSWGDGSWQDYATIKYDREGNEVWVARYDGPSHQIDAASAIALDAQGNVYVTGSSSGLASLDYTTIKYSQK